MYKKITQLSLTLLLFLHATTFGAQENPSKDAKRSNLTAWLPVIGAFTGALALGVTAFIASKSDANASVTPKEGAVVGGIVGGLSGLYGWYTSTPENPNIRPIVGMLAGTAIGATTTVCTGSGLSGVTFGGTTILYFGYLGLYSHGKHESVRRSEQPKKRVGFFDDRKVASKDYRVLGVGPNASAAEIKERYRMLALEYHPDKHSSEPASVQESAAEKYKKIKHSYELIQKNAESVH